MHVPTEEQSKRASSRADKMIAYYNGRRKRTWVIGVAAVLILATVISQVSNISRVFQDPVPPAAPQVKLVDEPFRVNHGQPSMPIPGKSTTFDVVEYYVYSATREAWWMWDRFFKKAGMDSQNLAIVSINDTDRGRWESRCAAVDGQEEGSVDPDHPFVLYCVETQLPHVWLPQVMLRKVWAPEYLGMVEADGKTVLDYRPAFAAAAVGVYAVGKFAIDELWQRASAPALPAGDASLVATCFVGAWAGTSNGLSAPDVVAAVVAISKLFSPAPAQNLQALVDAFMVAYRSGRPRDCTAKYWPGFNGLTTPSPSPSPVPLPTVSMPPPR